MNRKQKIQQLKRLAPVITGVTVTDDMGYEFSAVVPDGVIYPTPGMLLSYSGGAWPPDQWKNHTEEETTKLLRDFLLSKDWDVTSWEDLNTEDIEDWLEDANRYASEA
jgi:hypothetical protein